MRGRTDSLRLTPARLAGWSGEDGTETGTLPGWARATRPPRDASRKGSGAGPTLPWGPVTALDAPYLARGTPGWRTRWLPSGQSGVYRSGRPGKRS